MVCDGCDYDIVDQSHVTTLDFTFSEREGKHIKVPFHFHETSDSQDCMRYWLTGHGIMKRSLRRHTDNSVLFSEDDEAFVLRHLEMPRR
jgi:hypothetical protein